MDTNKFYCPNCGHHLKVIKQRGKIANTGRGVTMFDSTQPTGDPPRNWFGSLVYHLLGKHEQIDGELLPAPTREPIRVYTTYSDRASMSIDYLSNKISRDELAELAELVITREQDWSRANLSDDGPFSQGKFNLIAREFKRLGYLVIHPNNKSELTTPGKRFLRAVLAHRPPLFEVSP